MIKSLSSIASLLPFFFLIFGFCSLCESAEEPVKEQGKDVPGKLILKEIALPASTSFWNSRIRNLGEYKPTLSGEKELLQYWLFLPKDESAKSADGFPLMIFLHGAGERGNNPELVKKHGPPKLLAKGAADHWKFLTVAPQCPDGKYWSPDQILAFLDELILRYPIDQNRIYITGISMGGFATWMLLNKAPERFAAAVPICGGGQLDHPEKVVSIPIRIFHGDADSVVSPQFSRDFFDAIQKAGGKKVELTLYKNVGHDSWTRTYANPDLYEWLLQQKKNP
ncbi:MAG: prolyl oligopeptidase family serine peptidase [Planctomycetia bacterium]|nr:prolyl oligopeptidase family serine peptidase [Planctomycetia bacterium]